MDALILVIVCLLDMAPFDCPAVLARAWKESRLTADTAAPGGCCGILQVSPRAFGRVALDSTGSALFPSGAGRRSAAVAAFLVTAARRLPFHLPGLSSGQGQRSFTPSIAGSNPVPGTTRRLTCAELRRPWTGARAGVEMVRRWKDRAFRAGRPQCWELGFRAGNDAFRRCVKGK